MPTEPPKPSQRHWCLRPLWLAGFRRRYRWLIRIGFIIPITLILLLLVVARSPFTRSLVLRELRTTLNLDVQADAAYVSTDGVLVIDRARFRIPNVPGPAGQFLSIARVEADIDWWSVLKGEPVVRQVTMTEPVVIVSQSTQDRTLNVERLPAPSAGGAGGTGFTFPEIKLSHAAIELGEHTGAAYTPLRRVNMDGLLQPSSAEPGAFAFKLHEYSHRPRRPGGPKEPGFIVTGSRSQGRITVSVENFTLDDWPASSVPSPVRTTFQKLDLRGDVPRAIFAWAPDTGITAQLVMSGVGMNLAPLAPDDYFAAVAEGAPGPFPEFVRMRGVEGSITFARDSIFANVKGSLEDLPYSVKLRYDGLTLESPFTVELVSEDFRVDKNPGLLPYAPPKVREWLRLFTSPTAIVTTDVAVWRGAPVNGQPAEIGVRGTLSLKEGTAAYFRFPYEFREMVGRFEFDNDQVKIVSVRGKSPSGAELEATGIVAPLDDTAEVRVNVKVRNAPIDKAMEEAFGPERKKVLTSLFSQERYESLVAAGLIQSPAQALQASEQLQERTRALATAPPDQAAAIQAQITDLQRRITIPSFEFRGLADVDIAVLSPRGRNTEYQTDIDIRIARAGMVPEKFALPIVATGVVVKLDDDEGKLIKGEFAALGGGTADVAASFAIPARNEPAANPEIAITVRDLPLSPLIIHALPGSDSESKVKQILRDLNLAGNGNGTVAIGSRKDRPDLPLGFDADFTIAGARLGPSGPPGTVSVGEVSATIKVSEDDLDVRIKGTPVVAGAPLPDTPITASVSAQFSGDTHDRTTYTARGAWPSLDLTTIVEPLVRVFSTGAAAQIEKLRTEYTPLGTANIDLTVDGSKEPVESTTVLTPTDDLSIALFGDRLTVHGPLGSVTVHSGTSSFIRADALEGVASFAETPAGRLTLSGVYAPDQVLTAAFTASPAESSLVRATLDRKLSPESVAVVTDLSPRGIFDADVEFRTTGTDAESGAFTAPRLVTLLRPRALTLTIGGTEVVFPTMTGEVRIDDRSGVIRELRAQAAKWWTSINGAWETEEDGAFMLRTQLSGAADSLTPDLRAALPAQLRAVLDEIALKVGGPLSLADSSLELYRPAEDARDWTRFSGDFTFEDASLEAGASIADLRGRLNAQFRREAGSAFPEYTLDIDADGFRVGGVQLGRGHATLVNGDEPSELHLSEASGECYGGRYAATAHVFVAKSGKRRYEADTRLAGVRFNPLLADLSTALQRAAAPDPTDAELALLRQTQREDRSRGLMDAEVSLEGEVGIADSRRGRGTLRIHGGRVINFPFMTRLIELSDQALPTNAPLDFARGSLYIDGGLITFDDLSILSKNVEILGYGTMTWPEQIVDLRFSSRSARPIPVISELIRGIRDELVVTTVKGKLGEQEVGLQQFPGPRRMIGRAVGATPSDQSRRMDGLEDRVLPLTPRPSPPPVPATPSASVSDRPGQ